MTELRVLLRRAYLAYLDEVEAWLEMGTDDPPPDWAWHFARYLIDNGVIVCEQDI